ncbi:MAG: RagB/SusD family nutrient uptake outer membrane protein [Ferruginibacter sp.]
MIDDFTSGREIYTDNYIFRLAETYLLRGEAYINNSQADLAAADINKVRGRVNAAPITAASVNLHFILDERAREILWEEPRVLTLMRVGKFVERVKNTIQLRDQKSEIIKTFGPFHKGILKPMLKR